MPNGYAGRILWVDLTSGEIREETPDDRFYRQFVGGRGIGAWALLKNQSARVDALGPDNILGFTAGYAIDKNLPQTHFDGVTIPGLYRTKIAGSITGIFMKAYFITFIVVPGYFIM